MINIAYQGIGGSYSEQAINTIFSKEKIKTFAYSDFNSIFENLANNNVDKAVIPIENSLGGSIPINYDLLCEYNVKIIKEFNLKIKHCLLVAPGNSLENVKQIISHPQALHQCRHNINALSLEAVTGYDTAGCAKELSVTGDTTTAVIASDYAANKYGLTIIKDHFEDKSDNYTRFLVLSIKSDDILINKEFFHSKTSIAISINNSIGCLHKILTYFSLQNIDLTKIESRPLIDNLKVGNPFQYTFYLDFVGNYSNTKLVLENLEKNVSNIKILGNYKMDNKIYFPIIKLLKVGIIGFGRFGQFIAEYFSQFHQIYITSRSDYSKLASQKGYKYFSKLEDLLSEKMDCIIIAVSINSFENVVNKILDTKLLTNELIIDVLSVKKLPDKIFKDKIPSTCDILLTHPMFGPDSSDTTSWSGKNFVYWNVRINDEERYERWMDPLRECNLIEMGPELHDIEAAKSQCITYFIGKTLEKLGIAETKIDTNSFKKLLDVVKIVSHDSDDLFFGLIKNNDESRIVIEKFISETGDLLKSLNE